MIRSITSTLTWQRRRMELAMPSPAVWARCLAIVISACLLQGCVKPVPPTTSYGGETLPVTSSTPRRDGSALRESEHQLNDVRWQVIERKGPKTAGEQFDLSHKTDKD